MGLGLLRMRTFTEISGAAAVLMLLMSVMCIPPDESTPSPSVVIPAPPTESATSNASGSATIGTASAASTPADRRVRVSFAEFTDSNLARCTDIALLPPVGSESKQIDPEKLEQATEKFGQGIADGLRGDATLLPVSCQEAFKDRLELASCTSSQELAKGPQKLSLGTSASAAASSPSTPNAGILEFVERYYSFERAFGTDAVLRDCLKTKGKWVAISRDSVEYERAQKESTRKDFERRARQFEK